MMCNLYIFNGNFLGVLYFYDPFHNLFIILTNFRIQGIYIYIYIHEHAYTYMCIPNCFTVYVYTSY
jgi:hypothetical protein